MQVIASHKLQNSKKLGGDDVAKVWKASNAAYMPVEGEMGG